MGKAGQPVCIKKPRFGSHYGNADDFDAPLTEGFINRCEHSINWFLEHFHWGLALLWPCAAHYVIVFDMSPTLDFPGGGEEEEEEEKDWMGAGVEEKNCG